MTNDTISIRPIQSRDIPQIMQIQQQHNLATKSRETAQKEGFLVHLMNENEISSFLYDEEKSINVYERDNEVKAYVALYLKNAWLDENPDFENAEFKPEYSWIPESKYVYMRHIAKRKGAGGRVALELENRVFDKLANMDLNIILGEIALETPQGIANDVSMRFHKSIGFHQVGERREGLYNWAVMYLNLQEGRKNVSRESKI